MWLFKKILFILLIVSLLPMYIVFFCFGLVFLLYPLLGSLQEGSLNATYIGYKFLELLIKKPIAFVQQIHNDLFS